MTPNKKPNHLFIDCLFEFQIEHLFKFYCKLNCLDALMTEEELQIAADDVSTANKDTIRELLTVVELGLGWV